jgi:hypothetical protein
MESLNKKEIWDDETISGFKIGLMCAGKSKEPLRKDTGILSAVEVQAKPSFRETQGTTIKITYGPKKGMIRLESGTELFKEERIRYFMEMSCKFQGYNFNTTLNENCKRSNSLNTILRRNTKCGSKTSCTAKFGPGLK